MWRVDVRAQGPVFDDDEYADVIDDMRSGIRHELAGMALIEVRRKLASPWPSGIRQRTPYLETQLQVDEPSPHTSRVHNGTVVYRHWIEGTGSRNRPRPGFPGYHAFETAHGLVLREQDSIEARHLRRAVDRLNGR